MDKKTRETLIARILNTFRLVLKKQIATYLNGVDAVTISRNEDRERYEIKTDKVWSLPLTCDPKQFRVYAPPVDEFIGKVNNFVDKGELSNEGGEGLVRFVKDTEKAQRRTIIYVGRHSDEKNIRILIDAYQKLLSKESMCDSVHFLFIGTGYATTEIKHRFKENTSVIGLVPNCLLPDIFNFVRLRHGFFTSASDTETYGITHEEAQRCGLPLVAMYKGTRMHFYFPGDMMGEQRITVQEEPDITHAVASIFPSKKHFHLALNGICIPDFSGGKGLAVLNNSKGKTLAMEGLFKAMYTMVRLPVRVLQKMSTYAAKYTEVTKLGWDGTWRLLNKGIYPNHPMAYDRTMAPKRHTYRESKTFEGRNMLEPF